VLVAFAVFFQRYQASKTETAATATPTTPPVLLFDLGSAQLTDIKIADSAGKYIDLYRDPSSTKWAIEGVPAEQTDISQIDSLSTQLLGIQVQDTLTQTLSLAAIGLDNPTFTITVTSSAGTQSVIYVGMQTAIRTGYYVRDANGRVMIVDKTSLDDILKVLNSPPLLPTATPLVTPSETISPTVPAGLQTPTP
jgi:hypothetical protein